MAMNNPIVTTSQQTQPGTRIASIGNGDSVLGQLQPRIPTGGRIRAGIMVLTKAAAENQRAFDMYRAGVDAGTPFNKLAYQIKEACNLQRSPLTPKNVPYFTVRPSDFKVPGNAAAIMDLYGEERTEDEGNRHLYRFPVIFPLDNWQGNMPHQFSCYSANERKYWSEYDDTGGRYCMMHAPAKFTGEGQKRQAVRTAGGRRTMMRLDNDGICSPDDCPEYQSRACMLTGRFLFYIPGIPGSSAVELPTRSFYALQNARQQMEMMAYITGGRISGTHNGKALFFISKKNETISMIDPKTGKAKRVSQWIITLEAAVEMSQIFEHQEAAQALGAGREAATALGYASDPDDISGEFDVVNDDETVHQQESSLEKAAATGELLPAAPQPQQEQTPVAQPTPTPTPQEEHPGETAPTEPTLEARKIAAAIGAAEDVDTINLALDLIRNNDDITDDEVMRLHKFARARIKEVCQ